MADGWRSVVVAARLVAAKDLRIERRSRVGLGQVVPFALIVVLLFAFALDPDRRVLGAATPGLYWMIVSTELNRT
ncbi:MAG: heme exporter protein CcmB, partial [Actinomycetes bacterium]